MLINCEVWQQLNQHVPKDMAGRPSVICLQRLARKTSSGQELGKFVSGAPGRVLESSSERGRRNVKKCTEFMSQRFTTIPGPASGSALVLYPDPIRSLRYPEARVNGRQASTPLFGLRPSATAAGCLSNAHKSESQFRLPFSLLPCIFRRFLLSSFFFRPLDVYLGHVLLLRQGKKFRHKYWNLCSTRKEGWPNRPITKLSCPAP